MEFKIDICNSVQGDLTVLDLSKEYGQYLSEGEEVASTYEDTLLFKYSKSVTVNVLMKIGTTEITFLDALIHEHNQLENGVYKDDACTFNLKEDGFYTIDHYIFPNIDWYNWYKTEASQEYKDKMFNKFSNEFTRKIILQKQNQMLREEIERLKANQ